MTNENENHLIAERRAKLAALRAQGLPAYPNDFRRDALAADLLATYAERDSQWLEANPVRVRVGGRMMFKRVMGKASFAKLADRSGAIQLFLQEDALGAVYEAFKDYDVGDILGAAGPLFRTRTGELSVRVTGLQLLVKSLRPLPDKWHGLADTETRYRQRYLDLVMNDASRAVFHTRTQIVRYLRDALDALDFLEVETPMMQPIPGGAAARPFVTHHNALDLQMYLRIAPELYLKRLIVGGLERVYEINRNFRNEGLSTQHNPEFTMLELYWAYSDYRELMELIERLLHGLADSLLGTRLVNYQGRAYDLAKPFRRVSVEELILEHNPELERARLRDVPYLRAACERLGVPVNAGDGPANFRSRFSRRPPSPRSSIPLSCMPTRRRCRRCRVQMILTVSLQTVSSSSSPDANWPTAFPSSMTRKTRRRASGRRWRATRPGMTRPCTTTLTTSARSNTVCRRPRAWGSASTAW